MKKYIALLVALIATMFSVNAFAYDPPAAPSDGTYIVDQTGKLSASDKARLNQRIEAVNKATKNEFGILFLSNMGGENIEDVANATYKKWGVGKRGLDNGCLIVVSLKERKSRIETGKGVGADVTDIDSKEILTNNLNPYLKKGDFYGGFDSTLTALSNKIESRHNQKAEPPPVSRTNSQPVSNQPPRTSGSEGCSSSGAGLGGFSILVMFGFAGVLAIFFARYVARKAREEEERVFNMNQREAERARQAREVQERLSFERQAARDRERTMHIPTPAVEVPSVRPVSQYVPYVPPAPRVVSVPRVTATPPRPTPRTVTRRESYVPPTTPETPKSKTSSVAAASAVAAAAAATAALLFEEQQREARRREREEDDRREREAEARKREARAQREREEQEERDREASQSVSIFTPDYSSSYSSSTSSDDSSSYSGFGGGDSGGGGASSDWGSSDSSSSDSGSSWDSGSSDSGGGDSGGSSSDW